MTAVDSLFETSFDRSIKYGFCDLCKLNGFPNQKVIYKFEGLRPEEQDGFIYKFTIYEHNPTGEKRTKHIHKYNQNLIDVLVRLALKEQG
jgi:hypothetical protein